MSAEIMEWALLAGGAGQLAVAVLNLMLVRIMGWGDALDAMPLLVREVFQVHKLFITITLVLFGLWTLGFAGEMAVAASPLARAVAAGIGLFWAVRTVVQVAGYSSSHWRGKKAETVVHFILLAAYGGLAVVYAMAAAGAAA